jgi:S-formylglutathione hydrolase FrmB
MGAWGALHQAFTRPDVFNTVGGHSPALRTNEGWLTFLGEDEEFERKDPISLARTADSIEDLQVWIDIGEDDPWLERAELVHQHLNERGIRHEWHVFPGEHGGEYWEEHALEYLRFYGRALTRR